MAKKEETGIFIDSTIEVNDTNATITFADDSFTKALKEAKITVKDYDAVEACKSNYLDSIVDSGINQLKGKTKGLETVHVSAPFGGDNKYEAIITIDKKTKEINTVSKVDINYNNDKTFTKSLQDMMSV